MQPYPLGYEYDGQTILEVTAHEPNDTHQPYQYRLSNGELVWIPVGEKLWPKQFAEVSWATGDITGEYDCTPEEAAEFLDNNDSYIQEAMIAAGWQAIHELASDDDLQRKNQDV